MSINTLRKQLARADMAAHRYLHHPYTCMLVATMAGVQPPGPSCRQFPRKSTGHSCKAVSHGFPTNVAMETASHSHTTLQDGYQEAPITRLGWTFIGPLQSAEFPDMADGSPQQLCSLFSF